MRVEYRLAARMFGKIHHFQKESLADAERALDDMLDDFVRNPLSYVGADAEVWIEKRKVSSWKATVDLCG